MNKKLAVFTAHLGTASETFIRRHVEDLLPGRTVAIVRTSAPSFGDFWESAGPVLFLDRWSLRYSVRLARRVGVSEESLRSAIIARFLRNHDVGMVLGEYLDQFLDFVPMLNKLRIPYVVQGHGIDVSAALRDPGKAQRNLIYRQARAVLTRCEFHRQRLIQLGLPADKVQVNPGGVDIPGQTPARPAGANKRFLAVGRMVAKKGPLYLLESFRIAAATDPGIMLDYIGGGQLLPAARQFVDACDLHHCVRLHGAAPEETKQRLFQECGVFIQHSITDPDTGDEEGLPAAIQEAMAHGMAVVSTRHSGIPEAVEHGVTGLLVAERDARGMAAAISFLAGNEAEQAALGAAGRNKASKVYSWTAERARLLESLCPTA